MRRKRQTRKSKTMTNVRVAEVIFLRDTSDSSDARADEARNLIAQMIQLSHQHGRPAKEDEEMKDAA